MMEVKLNKEQLIKEYGHVPMYFLEHDNLYYFEADCDCGIIIIACDTIPNLATPQTDLPLIEFNDHIVGLYFNGDLTIYDNIYQLELEQKEDEYGIDN
jgi:hypothetical protein